ncbi:MAG: D-aminoacylase [Armatimonadetes bacterium]|nr:D-aminoacylase [Armatimonadota bacterium]
MTFDLLIRGGTVVDGSGGEPFAADVGISGDRIHAVGDLSAAEARDIIDASGLIVAPGFIDVHNHASHEAEGGILNIPDADNAVRQGVTTLISGNCGGSPWPLGRHLDAVERLEIRQNYGLLVGHGTIRAQAHVGPRAADERDIARMKDLAAQAMDEGAFGMSTGYFPEHVTTEEIAETAGPIGRAGGVYASHIRSESEGLIEAVEEAITIGEDSGCPVQISHIKCAGPGAWDKIDRVLELIETARARGLNVQADRYPYVASFTGVANLVPSDMRVEAQRRGGFEHLRDEDLLAVLPDAVNGRFETLGGPDRVMFAPLEPMPDIDGRRLDEVAAERGQQPWETALDLVIAGRISCIYFTMKEENVQTFMRHPAVFAGSDGHLRVFGRGVAHPRNYGTFPRWVGHYGRDLGMFTVQEVVRKCSAMPAEKFGLHSRGLLAPRRYADIVIFSWEEIIDRATFEDAHQYPEGIPHVIVNGRVAVRDGQTQEHGFGRVLRRC